jgi:hypothetical protein
LLPKSRFPLVRYALLVCPYEELVEFAVSGDCLVIPLEQKPV